MTKKRLGILLLAGITLLTFLALALPRFLRLDTYKPVILAELQTQLNRKVYYDRSSVSLGWGAVFTFHQVTISDQDQKTTFLAAKRLKVTVAIMSLIRGKLVVRELELDDPVATIIRAADGQFNINDLLQDRPGQQQPNLHKISLNNATLRFVDQAISQEPHTTLITAADLSLSSLLRGKKGSIRLKTDVTTASGIGQLAISGKYTLPPVGQPFSSTLLDVKISGKHLDAAHAWPYYRRYVPFAQVFGLVDIDTSFDGQLAEFTAKGRIDIAGTRFDYRPVFHAVLQPKRLRLAYQLKVSPPAVDVKAVDLLVDGIHFKGSCAITGIDGSNPRITATATSAPIDLAKYNAYIPYGIITKDVADYIEQHIKGGMLLLDEGRLDGTVKQITTMGVGTNYNVLSVSTRIEDGIVSYGPTVPTFNGVKGRLELKGKDFILSGMSGKFGSSPLTMQGRITEYPPTPAPCTFPFTMQMSPQQPEIDWLLGSGHGKRLHVSGEAPLALSGEGPTANYVLNGSWQLSPASYAFTDVVQKPSGYNSALTFKTSITKTALTIQSASYSLGPLQLSLSGKWQYASSPNQTQLTVGSNRFPIQGVAPLLPTISLYQPEGTVQTSLTAYGAGLDPAKLPWKGRIDLNGFGCKPAKNIKPLSGINTSLTLNDKSLETAQFTAMVGSTPLTGKGTYQWGDLPSWNISVTSPRVSTTDFGFTSPEKSIAITRVQGVANYKENTLAIKHLSGQVNKSFLTVRGSVSTQGTPTAALTISAPYLNVADVVTFAQLETTARKPTQSPQPKPWHLTAAIEADAGLLGDIAFTHLHAQTELKDAILYVQPCEFQAYGGKVSGKSRFDFGAQAPRYQASCAATKIDVHTLLADLGSKEKQLTGTMALTADITGKGNTLQECKNTALGTAKLKIEEGSINRFPILSKVFSILNVSQLLKFQLPDMVSGGMPFNDISATFAVADGTITTNNLYLASDAINISAVGSVNLQKNEINATIGAHPLQTIDKVVSRIPIVGWILTGKDKAFITTYFEAKGQLTDPKVTAIPVKSMAKGTLDIFKRIFTLPAKLITDTGEVLLNK